MLGIGICVQLIEKKQTLKLNISASKRLIEFKFSEKLKNIINYLLLKFEIISKKNDFACELSVNFKFNELS